uniref:(northern house mosquito) hypothetical protein n=1 Tax=Culex pipiens TaxID=7175 RepID=A0A8D8F293_CULPI
MCRQIPRECFLKVKISGKSLARTIKPAPDFPRWPSASSQSSSFPTGPCLPVICHCRCRPGTSFSGGVLSTAAKRQPRSLSAPRRNRPAPAAVAPWNRACGGRFPPAGHASQRAASNCPAGRAPNLRPRFDRPALPRSHRFRRPGPFCPHCK